MKLNHADSAKKQNHTKMRCSRKKIKAVPMTLLTQMIETALYVKAR